MDYTYTVNFEDKTNIIDTYTPLFSDGARPRGTDFSNLINALADRKATVTIDDSSSGGINTTDMPVSWTGEIFALAGLGADGATHEISLGNWTLETGVYATLFTLHENVADDFAYATTTTDWDLISRKIEISLWNTTSYVQTIYSNLFYYGSLNSGAFVPNLYIGGIVTLPLAYGTPYTIKASLMDNRIDNIKKSLRINLYIISKLT